jgi:sodium-dependent phosphate cotransporter
MGANITTFIDTLLAAFLLGNPDATSVVWAQMISVSIVSTVLLLTVYRRYEAGVLHLVDQLTNDNRKLGWFMLIILVLPITLFLL